MRDLLPEIERMTNALDKNVKNYKDVVDKIIELYETAERQNKKRAFSKEEHMYLIRSIIELITVLHPHSKSYAEFTHEYKDFVDKFFDNQKHE